MKSSSDLQHIGRFVPRNATALSILLVLVAVVNSATMGYDSAMMNGLSILPQYKEYFHVTTATTGLNNGAVWIGSVLGSTIIQPLSDHLGRKRAILVAGLVCLVGTIVQASAHSIAAFVAGRILVGIGSELASGPAPTLIAETLPARQRGPVLGLYWTCFFVGSLASAAINLGAVHVPTTWAWRLPSALQAVPSLLSMALLPLVPESPRWLVARGRADEARDVIAIMHGGGDVAAPETAEVLAEISAVLARERESSPANPWRELVATRANRRRMLILVSFGVMVEMFGNSVVSYYLGDMLDQAGITDTNTQLQVNVILSCWSFAVAVAGSLLVDVIGRRVLALSAIGGMIVSLYIFGGLTKAYGSSDNPSAVYGTTAIIFIFQGFYAFGITPMTSMYPPEILPYNMRNAGISLFRIIDSSFGLMATFAMSYAMKNLGWKFYFINASWNIVFFAIVYFTWVETRRMPLEEIALQFGDLDVQDIHPLDNRSGEVSSTSVLPPEKAL